MSSRARYLCSASDTVIVTAIRVVSQTVILDVAEAWDQKLEKTLSEDGKLDIVRISDDDWWETEADSYTSLEFEKTVPANATIQSVRPTT